MYTLNKNNSFIVFTISLVVLLLVYAAAHTLPRGVGNAFAQIMTLTTLAIAYFTLRFGPLWRHFVALILLLVLLANALDALTDWPGAALAPRVIALLFFAGATVNCGRQVLLTTEVGTNVIVGVLAIYLLLGIIWATLYLITLYFFPLAFNGIAPAAGADQFPRLLYFSYVTLATLGYGDIVPVNPVSKTLAYMEAIVGTFYLAIVVASLIASRHQTTRK